MSSSTQSKYRYASFQHQSSDYRLSGQRLFVSFSNDPVVSLTYGLADGALGSSSFVHPELLGYLDCGMLIRSVVDKQVSAAREGKSTTFVLSTKR